MKNISSDSVTIFNICSYNCKSFNDSKILFIKTLFSACNIIMLQEHCLYKSNLHYFSKISDHIGYVGSSAMDESFLLYGRPYGGCAIIWNNKMKYKVTQVDCTSKRLCGINIAIGEDVSFVVLNVYMPCDERQRGRNLDEFSDVLDEISVILHNLQPMYFLVGGDFNTDFNRVSPQTKALIELINVEDIYSYSMVERSTGIIPPTFQCCYDKNITSTIDHVFVSSNLKNYLVKHEVSDGCDNLSDHCAVNCKIDIPVYFYKTEECMHDGIRVVWNIANRASIEKYKIVLDEELNNKCIENDLFLCDDFNCNDSNHQLNIDVLYQDIISYMLIATYKCINCKTKSQCHRGILGWKEFVAPLHDKSIFWRKIWRDCGSPKDGVVFTVMQNTRRKYHQAVKIAKWRKQKPYVKN